MINQRKTTNDILFGTTGVVGTANNSQLRTGKNEIGGQARGFDIRGSGHVSACFDRQRGRGRAARPGSQGMTCPMPEVRRAYQTRSLNAFQVPTFLPLLFLFL